MSQGGPSGAARTFALTDPSGGRSLTMLQAAPPAQLAAATAEKSGFFHPDFWLACPALGRGSCSKDSPR
jgi:hypothetical protein